MKTIFEIWVIFGIFGFFSVFISSYFFFNIFAMRRRIVGVSITEHLITMINTICSPTGKFHPENLLYLFLSCVIMGPIALIRTTIDAYETTKEIFDEQD